jgi:predicted enzyme related to lactoylglutathione lyase
VNESPNNPSPQKPLSSSPRRHVPTRGLYGWITHTELASSDPESTKSWCAEVLGWTFKPSFSVPGGEYHLFAYSDQGGGGIRPKDPAGAPNSTPYVHVEDAHDAFEKALRAGAEEVLPPTRMAEGVTTALVRAPGGVRIGFSGP